MSLPDRMRVLCRYQVGVSLRIRLAGGSVLRWRATLHACSDRGDLWLRLHDVPGVIPLIAPGSEVAVVFRDRDQGLAGRFHTVAVQPLQVGEQGALLHVRLPARIEDVNLREFCRVRVGDDEAIRAQLSAPGLARRLPLPVALIDISAGGAQVHVPTGSSLSELRVGSRVLVHFAGQAVQGLAKEQRTAHALVRRTESAPGGRCLGIEFEDATEPLRRALVRHVFARQRDTLRSRLHSS